MSASASPSLCSTAALPLYISNCYIAELDKMSCDTRVRLLNPAHIKDLPPLILSSCDQHIFNAIRFSFCRAGILAILRLSFLSDPGSASLLLRPRPFADLTDVTLADEDTN